MIAQLVEHCTGIAELFPLKALNMLVLSLSACPLSLGLEDGRIKDEQMSASSELDKKHTAKKGRISYRTDPNRLGFLSANYK